MSERMVIRKRRPAQARKVRRLEMNRAGVHAVIRQGTAWTAVNTARLPGVALAIASLALLIFFFVDPRFYVYEAQVTGHRLTPAEEIYQACGADMSSIFFVAPRAIQTGLLNRFPGLADVRVAVGLPARLAVRVAERAVHYAWEAGGQTLLADERGIVLGAGAPPAGVLHIQAAEGQPPAAGQALDVNALQTAATLSPLLEGSLRFEYAPGSGISWRTPQGWPVHFGLGGDLLAKVAVMRSMTDQFAQEGVTPQFLDVSVPSRPFYR